MATTDTKVAPSAATSSIPTPGTRKVDSKLAISIINRRATLKVTDAGRLMQFIVQGGGQFLPKGHKWMTGDVERENQFDRTIYNLKANSAIAMQANKGLFTEALKAESAGDTDKAHDLFNEYLNAIQISFSVIDNGNGRSARFNNGSVVKAIVGTSVSALTNATSIIVDNVSEVVAEVAAKTTFSIDDLMEEVAAPAAQA